MDSTRVIDQLDLMIDDLLNQTDLPASSLASILMAARDSVKDGYHVALARRVWAISNSIKCQHVNVSEESILLTGSSGIDGAQPEMAPHLENHP